LLKRFGRGQKGTAGMLFALAAIPMFALAGGVIDYVYLQNEEAKLQSAADAAVLAAMKLEAPTDEEIRQTIVDYLRSNYARAPRVHLDLDNIEIETLRSDDVITRVNIVIPAKVDTTFWSLLGIHEASLRVEAEASHGFSGLEVVMVLDNTGSMQGSKIEELRQAAKDMVDILSGLANNPQFVTLKVGMVPYTSYVNVGTDKAGASWLNLGGCCGPYEWKGWVGSRSEPLDVSDADYDTSPVPAVPNFVVDLYNNVPWEDQGDTLQEIVPLKDLREAGVATEFKNRINDMEAFGWTYIPGGLVWGWRVLSPQEPYTGGMDYDEARRKNVKKVIVLMTDGANTCRNTGADVRGFPAIKECGVESTDADERMRAVCEAIKAKGILITSVAYEVEDENIRNLMEECSNFGYYTPRSGELAQVFQDIARRLTKLHLSK
jgi:hypothetical protein